MLATLPLLLASSPRCSGCTNRRAAVGFGAAAAFTSTCAVPAATARKPSPPQLVTDRNGVGVTETSWLKGDHSRADLVLGLDGEPYFLLTEKIASDEPTRRLLDYALKAECTHLGCLVQDDVTLLAGPGGFACPCHGSKYDAVGSVTRGPAPTALGIAKVAAREGDGMLVMIPWVGDDPRKDPDSAWKGSPLTDSPLTDSPLTALAAGRPPMLYASAAAPRRAPPPAAMATSAEGRVVVEVDLGKAGEPAGKQRLSFKPKLARSDFIMLDLKVPLGMLIEETDEGDIVIEGAMPGYSSAGGYDEPDLVRPGDLLRAVTAYRQILSGAPMWQQLASYTPVGKLELKRLVFRTEGATFADVRDAIASHRIEDGGDGVVTLVLEREVNASTPVNTTRDTAPPRVEPLADVIKRDLQKKRVADDLTKQVEGMSAAERTQRLLDLGFDVKDDDGK